jgi:hypothetical protein
MSPHAAPDQPSLDSGRPRAAWSTDSGQGFCGAGLSRPQSNDQRRPDQGQEPWHALCTRASAQGRSTGKRSRGPASYPTRPIDASLTCRRAERRTLFSERCRAAAGRSLPRLVCACHQNGEVPVLQFRTLVAKPPSDRFRDVAMSSGASASPSSATFWNRRGRSDSGACRHPSAREMKNNSMARDAVGFRRSADLSGLRVIA